jgi:hypothetical protein
MATAVITAFFVSCVIRVTFADHAVQTTQPVPIPVMEKEILPAEPAHPSVKNEYIPMSEELWRYLRKGLNYVEASGEEYPPDFLHPGGRAYGPLALTPIAVEDVRRRYAAMSRYAFSDVISDPAIYEEFARCYADLLLRHYLCLAYWNMPAGDIFTILQKAWFLGPGLYKEGLSVPDSRQTHAGEFMAATPSAFASNT